MKLIEGMKKLKVIEKKIQHNTQRINEYAAIVSSERPIFGTEVAQRTQIQELIQSNKDLASEYLSLKKRVDLTNIKSMVSIGKDTFSISDLLQIQRNVAKLMKETFSALNDREAQGRLQSIRQHSAEKPPHIDRMYDENEKHKGLQYWQGLEDEIETRLEVINATTDLIEL